MQPKIYNLFTRTLIEELLKKASEVPQIFSEDNLMPREA